MGKTYEALKRAEAENRQKHLEVVRPAKIRLSKKGKAARYLKLDHLRPYEHLKTSLMSRYPNRSTKTILLNGTKHGGGCSTTALNLAATLAQDPDLKVILVEVNLRTPSLKKTLKIEDAPDLTELVDNMDQMSSRIEKIGSENLYVIACGGSSLLGPLGLFESKQFDQFLQTLRDRFDYVILDAPPVPVFSEFRVLCKKVDGVVLVVQAEKTRRQVGLQAKREIEEAGGKLLGVFLNRRKYYIPSWIYKRL